MLNTATDVNGKVVRVGSRVRVLKIPAGVTKNLSDKETRDVNSMLNDVLEVYEIDDYGCAREEKWWDRGEGKSESHSLSLSSVEMELV